MWLCMKRKSEWKKKTNNTFYYFVQLFITLYYFIGLYVKVKTEMLGEL